MASLTWSTPEKDKKRYIFYKKATSIGASVDNDIVMPKSASCQPHHARVIFDGRDFSVVAVDKGASVIHKKKRKSKCRLKDGDSVTIGDVEMRFDVLDTDVAVQEIRRDENHHGGMVTTDDQAELKGLRRLCDFSRVLMSKTELP
ncbi:MAG: FHA domain-containing protein, partial [Deltaproteobacteria bacterium]|nr:FHA domain-containing protein [Deltaproteobacteria bacterium]